MSGTGYGVRTAGTVAASYSIVVPPGFVRVPGGVEPAEAAAAVAAQLGDQPEAGTATAPDDWRLRLGSALERALAADADGRLLDSYLSAGPLPGTDIVCSIVVATVPVTRAEHADLDCLLLRRVATHGASPLILAGDPAVVWDDPCGDSAPDDEYSRHHSSAALTPPPPSNRRGAHRRPRRPTHHPRPLDRFDGRGRARSGRCRRASPPRGRPHRRLRRHAQHLPMA